MKHTGLFVMALLGATALTAPAYAGDFDITAEGFAAATRGTADYINADKPDNELDGTFYGLRVGAEYAFGESTDGLFVGATYYQTLGDGVTSAPKFNGNVLQNWATFTGFKGWEVLAGWDFGRIAVGYAYGEMEREGETFQSCVENHLVLNLGSSGFCGSAVPGVADQREGVRGGAPQENTADSSRFFVRYDATERYALTLSYQAADFGQSVAPLAVVPNAANVAAGNRTPHPDTSYAQDFEALMLGAQARF